MDIAASKIKQWREDSVLFAKEVLDVELDEWQRDALIAFSGKDRVTRVALSACAGPGKSFVLAVAAWNFLLCYGGKGEHPKGFAISMSAENLEQNLWPELYKIQSRSELLLKTFTWTKSRIFANDHPSTWFIQARGFSKSANKEEQGRSLSGLHSEAAIVIADEIGSIDPVILKAAEQAFGNCKTGKIIAAGNPSSRSSALYEITTRLRDKWKIIRITGDPDDPKRSPRIDIDWARSEIERFSISDPWVQCMILGIFPESSIDTLLTIEEVEESIARKYPLNICDGQERRIGVDVARFGTDSSVWASRSGLIAFNLKEMRGARGHELAAAVSLSYHKWGADQVFVDVTGGTGASCADSLLQSGIVPVEVYFSGKPMDSRFYNKRSEMYWLMAEWVKRGGKLPNHPKLVADLVTPTFSFKGGKLLLEDKETMRKRLGRSCDFSDALACTFALPDMPRQTHEDLIRAAYQNPKNRDWDPYRDA